MANISPIDIVAYEDFLPQQYSESLDARTLLRIYLQEIQLLENANVDLDKYSTDIELAFGYQLDIIGKLIGVPRNGMTDEQYRDAIYFGISVNIGDGNPEDVIQYLSYVTQASNVNYWEHYPASIILETNGTVIPDNITNLVDNIAPAGVSIGGVIVSETGEVFRGCEDTDADANRIDLSITEVGAELSELGAFGSELTTEDFTSLYTYADVDDSDPLARCIFPEDNEIYELHDVEEVECAGDDLIVTYLPPFNEVGGINQEAGNIEAEAKGKEVLPSSVNPLVAEMGAEGAELTDTLGSENFVKTYKYPFKEIGNPLMENEALKAEMSTSTFVLRTTKGIFAEIYTEI